MSIRPYKGVVPKIHETAFVDEAAIVIGDVTIGEDSSFWPCVVARGDVHSISVGARTNVQDGTVLHVTHDSKYVPGGRPLVIGDDVTIGHGAVVHACTIGNEVLVGMNATVLDGAVVEDQVMIGAGAVVGPGKRLQSGYLYVGSPVRQARELTEEQRVFLKYSASNYVEIAKSHQSD